ncbi:MAG TPA: MlaD family protein [Candidatus Binatia bacterium]|nr:MlaD family protein [Candidatus Binatia bacterium]
MPDTDTSLPPVPESRAHSRQRTRLSLVWIIPIVAAIAGAWVAATRILGEGPKITIVFKSAEGLEAGKTKIQFNGVEVGTVTTIRLSDDHKSVITTAQMAPKTDGFLVDDTRFWVVRPRISGANVTGLGTLISGSYIAMDIGHSGHHRHDFVALETPPVVTGDVPGRFFVLKTPDLGSLDTGTPVFFRRLQVGQVASYELAKDGRFLNIRVFVNAPYDQYVTLDTRFWHASGIDVSLSASGLSVQTQSALSLLVGGIAFETPPTLSVLPAAEPDTEFTLFANRTEAFKLPERDPQIYRLVFKESVRGLAVGAPVEFRGIAIGEVTQIDAQIDAKTFEFSSPVTVRLEAQRLGVKVVDLAPGADTASIRRQLMDSLVAHGVRAQLRTGNLLTGALFIAFDFFPDAPATTLNWSQSPVHLPTVPGQFEGIEANVANIIKKLDQVPIKAIGDDLHKALADLDRTLVSARATLQSGQNTLDNAGKLIEPNSVLETQLSGTLQDVSRAARSLTLLLDYLERHPEALIRGKTEEAQ